MDMLGELGGMLGGPGARGGSAPGLASMLDLDRNPLDDILAMAGKLLR